MGLIVIVLPFTPTKFASVNVRTAVARRPCEIRQQDRAIVARFAEAVRRSDLSALVRCLNDLDMRGLWPMALRAVARGPVPMRAFQKGFLRLWVGSGDHMRGEARSDLDLIAALGILLPRYQGPAQTLWRE